MNTEFYQAILKAIKNDIRELKVCLPAKIEKYDSNSQSADVLLMIKEIDDQTGEQDNPEQFLLTGVPVQFPSGSSNCFVSFPVNSDTFGCVIFADKSLDDYLQSDGLQPVEENLDPRMHDLSDAVFVPGMRPYSQAISGYSSDNMVLKNSSMKIELAPNGKISITGGTTELIEVLSEAIGSIATYATQSNLRTANESLVPMVTGSTMAVQYDAKYGAGSYAAITLLITNAITAINTQKSKIDLLKVV